MKKLLSTNRLYLWARLYLVEAAARSAARQAVEELRDHLREPVEGAEDANSGVCSSCLLSGESAGYKKCLYQVVLVQD